MAFVNTPNEGVPFYRGVEPKVPVPDDTAAKIISAGTATGVNAFVQMALAKERNALAQQELLQRADLQARQLDFQREEMADRHGLAVSGQDIQRGYMGLARERLDDDFWMENQKLQIEQDLAPSRKKLLERQSQAYGSALSRNVAFAEQTASMLDDAGKDAEEFHLFDPEFQTKKPMEYARNAYAFEARWGATVEPRLKATVAQFIKNAEESKVTLKDATGTPQKYSWAQVVKDIAMRQEDSPFIQQLQDANYFDTKKSEETVVNAQGITVPRLTTRTPKPELKAMLEGGKAADFPSLSKEKSKVQPFGAKNATEAIARGTLDLGVQPPPGPGGSTTMRSGNIKVQMPLPEQSPAETEADIVREKANSDPANRDFYVQTYLKRYPGSVGLIADLAGE